MSKLVDSQNTDIKSCRARAGLDVTPPPSDSFSITCPALETFGPPSGTLGFPALISFFLCVKFDFLLRTTYTCCFFLITFLNKTNCLILHNTIKPLHVQYQCPITDYKYGKRCQISCIKKISFLLKM